MRNTGGYLIPAGSREYAIARNHLDMFPERMERIRHLSQTWKGIVGFVMVDTLSSFVRQKICGAASTEIWPW